jgi:hypothetical protein
MMNTFCVPISLDLNPLTKPLSDYGTAGLVRVPTEDISAEFTDFLQQRNIKILLAEIFYNPPFKISQIHVDAVGGDFAKINFIYGGPKSLMCWYHTDVVKNQIDYTIAKTRSINYQSDEVNLVHRQTLISPSIVQVGIPHNIINTARERWCVSIVPVSAETQKNLSFQNTVDLFKDLVQVTD